MLADAGLAVGAVGALAFALSCEDGCVTDAGGAVGFVWAPVAPVLLIEDGAATFALPEAGKGFCCEDTVAAVGECFAAPVDEASVLEAAALVSFAG